MYRLPVKVSTQSDRDHRNQQPGILQQSTEEAKATADPTIWRVWSRKDNEP
jgi:hypothetical protein